MKYQVAVPLLLSLSSLACATVKQNPYAYQELDSCPASMSEEQHYSGVVRCRAMCSSYARDFAEFTADCRCWCAPSSPGGRYQAKPKRPPQPPAETQTSVWSPAVTTAS